MGSVQGFIYPNEMELQWSILIVLYPFITGLVAGAFILASLERTFNVQAVKPTYRLALLTALPELSRRPWLWKSLEVGLLDRDGDLRQAASEAVFSLGLDDHGYDPSGPPGEREAAVREILQDARVV